MATTSLQAAYDQARSFLEQNKIEYTIAVAQHVLEHFPDNLEAHRILGEAYLAGRQFDQAEAAFSRVLHADPESIPAHVGLGITYERQGRLDRAVSEFEQALEIRPDMPELRSQLLRLYTDVWGAEGASLRLSRSGLARLYAKGHMLPQAAQEFRSVIEEYPDRFDARIGLAEVLWRDGQEELAAEACKEVLDERPDLLKANLLFGYIKLANGDESGGSYWQVAQRLDPYQHVAQALFETQPDFPLPSLQLPAWEEQVWQERRVREDEERHRQESEARRAQEDELRRAQAAQLALSAASAGADSAADDDLFGDSWMNALETSAPQAPVGRQVSADNDDFLASLLSFEEIDDPELNVGSSQGHSNPDLDLGNDDLEPFTFSDIDTSPNAASAVEPFSLNDIALDDDEGLKDAPLATPQAAPAASDEPEMTPFSFEDLGLSPEEIAALEGTPTPQAAPAASDEPEMTPFSFEDLGLSPEEIAALEGTPTPQAAPAASDEPEMTPFSLEDLGLGPEEMAQFEVPTSSDTLGASSATNTTQQVESLSSLEPFDWTSADADAVTSEFDEDDELSKELTPFSLADLDLSSSGAVDLSESLPPSLQPFSIDEMAPPPARPQTQSNLPPSVNDDSDRAGYSWQSPTRKNTGFLRDRDATPLDSGPSIFAKLKQRHEELPPAAPAEPFSNGSDDTASGFFSDDDISLRDEQAASTPNKFASGFRLPKEHELAEDSSQPAASPPVPFESDEPELTPFSLEDLGLSPEEIAMLGGESAPTPAAAAPAQPAPVVNDEPELTPFSLEDLGLSPEEIAMLGGESAPPPAAATPAAAAPAQPAPVVNDEPELTPFSLEDLGLSPEEIAMLGGESAPTPAAATPASKVEPVDDMMGDLGDPFSFDEYIDGTETEGAPRESDPFDSDDVKPFSFDDLDDDPPGDSNSMNRELGLTTDELADFTLGEVLDARAKAASNYDADSATVDTGDPTLDRLVMLGQRNGYVDITDIIAEVKDPEAEAERIEEIGWILHRAGIQIRDGDEIIDMEATDGEVVEEEIFETTSPSPVQPVPAPPASTPVVSDEPEMTPFSLEDLGLSPEEIAALGLGDVTTPELPAPSVPPPVVSDEPEMTPFSLEDLGLSPEEIAALGLGDVPTPEPPAPPAPAPVVSDEPDMTPFSLEDLGLSPEEIAALGLGDASVTEVSPEPQPEPAPAPVVSDEPEMTPFSLEDLGLSPEEIAALGLGDASVTDVASEPEPEPAPAPVVSDEPEMTPFSLEDLGLSPEEIAALSPEVERIDVEPAPSAGTAIDDLDGDLDFGIVDAAPAEQIAKAKRTAPRTVEPEPTVAAEDIGFTAEPLDALDDIWDAAPQLPSPEPAARPTVRPEPQNKPEPPARVVLPPRKERPAPVERSARERPARERPAPVERPRNTPTRAGWGRGRESAPSSGFGSAGGASLPKADVMPRSFIPTGDETLDAYLIQLESEPQNLPLHLAIARIAAQTGRLELMVALYRQLIKTGQALSQIVDEVEDLIAGAADTGIERQLYRTLGDAYSRQGHLREAVAAYSHTVQ